MRFRSILKPISRSTVIQVFLENEFVAAECSPKELFLEHLKYIRHLTPADVVDFVKDVCFDPIIAASKVSPHFDH